MIIAGTGHRVVEPDVYKEVVDFTRKVLVDNQPSLVITGMATGFDLLLGELAVDVGLDVLAAVPYLEHYESGIKNHKSYKKIIDKASDVVLVSEPGYAIWKMHARNRYMVDRADLLVAYYSDVQSGGTYQCIKYALKKGVRVFNVYPGRRGEVHDA